MKIKYIATICFIGLLITVGALHNWVALVGSIISPLLILLMTRENTNLTKEE